MERVHTDEIDARRYASALYLLNRQRKLTGPKMKLVSGMCSFQVLRHLLTVRPNVVPQDPFEVIPPTPPSSSWLSCSSRVVTLSGL